MPFLVSKDNRVRIWTKVWNQRVNRSRRICWERIGCKMLENILSRTEGRRSQSRFQKHTSYDFLLRTLANYGYSSRDRVDPSFPPPQLAFFLCLSILCPLLVPFSFTMEMWLQDLDANNLDKTHCSCQYTRVTWIKIDFLSRFWYHFITDMTKKKRSRLCLERTILPLLR